MTKPLHESPFSTFVVYHAGTETSRPSSLPDTIALLDKTGQHTTTPDPAASLEATAATGQGVFAWININLPTLADINELASALMLPPLALEDAIEMHQRPKFETYDEQDFLVLRPATLVPEAASQKRSQRRLQRLSENGGGTSARGPLSAKTQGKGTKTTQHESVLRVRGSRATSSHSIAVGETHVFIGANFVAVINHTPFVDLEAVRTAASTDPGFCTHPHLVAVHRILDHVIDNYYPLIDSLEDHSDEIEEAVFSGTPVPSGTVYKLSREVLELDRAIAPLQGVMESLRPFVETSDTPPELMRQFRDVADHVRDAKERNSHLRAQMHELFSTNTTLISERQNEQMKQISGWAGILFFPSLVAGVYGMNFDLMPELHWSLGYPFALFLMLAGSSLMYLIFKRAGWL